MIISQPTIDAAVLLTAVCLVVTRLYKERLSQVDIKLKEVIAGCAQEYLEPLANLQENMQIRTKVAGKFECNFSLH
jgi:hypothetical protein